MDNSILVCEECGNSENITFIHECECGYTVCNECIEYVNFECPNCEGDL